MFIYSTYLILNADTSISQVSVDPMTIKTLTGTTNVTLTCSIQLNNDIGPDHSASNVSWWSPASTKPGSLTTMSMTQQKSFNSTLNIPLITQGQLYCCNASLAGYSTVVSSCTDVKTSGIQLKSAHIMCYLSYVLAIEISDPFQNLTIGSTAAITCSVANVSNTDFKWLYQNGSVVNNSHVLTLEPVNYTHNGRVFICLVSSSQLHSPGKKNITVTVQGI